MVEVTPSEDERRVVSLGGQVSLYPVTARSARGRVYWEVATSEGRTPMLFMSGTEALSHAVGVWARAECRKFTFILEP